MIVSKIRLLLANKTRFAPKIRTMYKENVLKLIAQLPFKSRKVVAILTEFSFQIFWMTHLPFDVTLCDLLPEMGITQIIAFMCNLSWKERNWKIMELQGNRWNKLMTLQKGSQEKARGHVFRELGSVKSAVFHPWIIWLIYLWNPLQKTAVDKTRNLSYYIILKITVNLYKANAIFKNFCHFWSFYVFD